MSGRPEEAEKMILKLSTFFRSSLSLDPSADVTLAEEIALQTPLSRHREGALPETAEGRDRRPARARNGAACRR